MNETMINKLQALAENQEFAEKMQDVADTAEMVALLKEYGVEVTEAELAQCMSFSEVTDGELGEDMLEGISGGCGVCKVLERIAKEIYKRHKNDMRPKY